MTLKERSLLDTGLSQEFSELARDLMEDEDLDLGPDLRQRLCRFGERLSMSEEKKVRESLASPCSVVVP